jgi:hypothetical protein
MRDNKIDDAPPEAKRDLRALGLEKYVTKVVAGWPPLNDEQLVRIAALLKAGGAV